MWFSTTIRLVPRPSPFAHGPTPLQNRRNIDITLTMARVVSRTYRWHAICIEVQERYKRMLPTFRKAKRTIVRRVLIVDTWDRTVMP
jgi:hypothetical protein